MPRRHPSPPQKQAIRASLIFLAIGAFWVLVSDLALYRFVRDPGEVARLETAKGWLFVAVSCLLVYLLTLGAVTRMQRAEATMGAVVSSIADGVFLVGRDTRITEANAAAARVLGEPDPGRLVGVGPEEFSRRYHVSFTDGRIVPPHEYASQRALRGVVVPAYEALVNPGTEKERVILATSAPVRARAGGPVDCVVSVMHDITDRYRLEHLRDEFFAAAAHALKTPLAIVKAHAQLLSRRAQVEVDRTAAIAIDRQCGVMDRLIQNMFVLARFRSGSLRLHQRSVEVVPIAESVSREMGSASPDREIRLEAGASPTAFADPERLAQVLRNLVDAALRRSPAGTPVAILVEQEGGTVRLGVRSRGLTPGEPAGDRALDHLGAFDGGVGLEAHVNERIVAASGGRVLGGITAGEFTTSWVEIPATGRGAT